VNAFITMAYIDHADDDDQVPELCRHALVKLSDARGHDLGQAVICLRDAYPAMIMIMMIKMTRIMMLMIMMIMMTMIRCLSCAVTRW
jgi:hypothetical protein